jgi:hypothetical protein
MKAAVQRAKSQAELWWVISAVQEKVGREVVRDTGRFAGRSSLPLTLEDEDLRAAVSEYTRTLIGTGHGKRDVLGCAHAINGEIYAADIYACNALFRKVWPRLLGASALEARLERKEGSPPPAPSKEAVLEFLRESRKGRWREVGLSGWARRFELETGKAVRIDSRAAEHGDVSVHTVCLAKRKGLPEWTIPASIQERVGAEVLKDLRTPPKIDGTVVGTSDKVNLVVVSAGEEDGVRVGFEFTVYRGSEYVGKLIVEKTFPRQAACRILAEMTRGKITKGDRVSTQVY